MERLDKKKHYLVLGRVTIILLISFISIFLLIKKQNAEEVFSAAHPNTIIGSIKNDHDPQIEIYYPLTKNQTVNSAVRSYVDSQLEDVMNGTNENDESLNGLYINFKAFGYGESIVSFVFEHSNTSERNVNEVSHFYTMTYDLVTGNIIELMDIFLLDNYLDFLSEQIYNQLKILDVYKDQVKLDRLRTGTLAKLENFQHFAIDVSGINFYFDNNQIGSEGNDTNQVLIDWEQLSGFINEQVISNDFLSKDKLLEEKDQEVTYPLVPDSELEDQKLIALTFDDGPHPTLTPRLLDILKEHNVNATFFVVGSQVEENPEIVSRAFLEGNQIGNHTYSHKDLTKLSVEELKKEIMETAKQIEEITGDKPNLLRPPYGSYNDQVLTYVDAAMIMWSIDPEDWKNRDASAVYNHVIEQAEDGDIVLLHDIHKTTIEAIESIILKLKEKGFKFVTVEQLIKARDQLSNGQVYFNVPIIK